METPGVCSVRTLSLSASATTMEGPTATAVEVDGTGNAAAMESWMVAIVVAVHMALVYAFSDC